MMAPARTGLRALAFALPVAVGLAGAAAASCRLGLVLALDVSGSVDAGEYRLQIDGLAGALADPSVGAALFAMPGANVDLTVFEWSGPNSARVVLDWTTIDSPATLATAIDQLRGTPRQEMEPATAIGSAMLRGAGQLQSRAACWRRAIDISGDGESNMGPRPQSLPDAGALAGITINGLVIGEASADQAGSAANLQGYYIAYVIRGPDAFVEVASGFDNYQEAMRRKLVRELQVLAVAGGDSQ